MRDAAMPSAEARCGPDRTELAAIAATAILVLVSIGLPGLSPTPPLPLPPPPPPTASPHPPIELYAYDGVTAYDGAAHLPHLFNLRAAKLRTIGRTAPIDEVHNGGLLHRGIWLFVLDQNDRILMLRRAEHVATCAASWGLVGEHSDPGEAWEATARRALREELGISVGVAAIHQLPGLPVLFKARYESTGKKDLQCTALLVARLPPNVDTSALQFDEDVAEARWVSKREIEDALVAADEPRQSQRQRAAPPSRDDAEREGNGNGKNRATRVKRLRRDSHSPPVQLALCSSSIRELLALALRRLGSSGVLAAGRGRGPRAVPHSQ